MQVTSRAALPDFTNISLSSYASGVKDCEQKVANNKAAVYETKQLVCFSAYFFLSTEGPFFSEFSLARRITRGRPGLLVVSIEKRR